MQTAPPPDQVDLVFRAFSDRTRLRILNLLRGGGETCVCDLIAVLDLPQAKVSRHLAYLRRAGLVETRREGPWVHYRLTRPDGAFHRKMLECLRCCLAEVPELKADRERLAGAERGPLDCC
jgi:ArsR family transcriptional regulator